MEIVSCATGSLKYLIKRHIQCMKMSTENSYKIEQLTCFSSWETPNEAKERTVFWKINFQKCYWSVYNSSKEKNEISELRTLNIRTKNP